MPLEITSFEFGGGVTNPEDAGGGVISHRAPYTMLSFGVTRHVSCANNDSVSMRLAVVEDCMRVIAIDLPLSKSCNEL